MKRSYISLISLTLIVLILILIRVYFIGQVFQVFEYDSLGYYLYLPSRYIYHDIGHLNWWNAVNSKYHFPGSLYQASLQPNGKYVFFYEIGISILQTPFFFIGHFLAGILGYDRDGFSLPYQISLASGTIFYAFVGLIILRKILLRYFGDGITAWTLLLITLATNYPQYVSVDGGFTHGYLFTMACLLLLFTIRWHDKPSILKAGLIGFIIGFIAVIRVTDAIMMFVPILWNTQTKESRHNKWSFIKQHPLHILAAGFGLIIPILPQLFYWKEVTGHWIHQMGSKWDFLLPHLRVLFGWEKGWFIYTPVTILIVIGLFFIKKGEYKRSVITYFLLNVWIVTAWHEWRYGGTYSARALTQSLAIMSLPLAVLLERISFSKWVRIFFVAVSVYLCCVNLFQIWQYNNTIIHYDDMNRKYYMAVYLNPSPSPKDMSLLDTDERMEYEKKYILIKTISLDSTRRINGGNDSVTYFLKSKLSDLTIGKNDTITWVRLIVFVKSDWGAFGTYFVTELSDGSLYKKRAIRMQNGISDIHQWNKIEYDFSIPNVSNKAELRVCCKTNAMQNILLKDFKIEMFGLKP